MMFTQIISFLSLTSHLSCQQTDNPLKALLGESNLQKADISDGDEPTPGEEVERLGNIQPAVIQ